MGLLQARVVIAFQQDTAALDDLGKLLVNLETQKLRHRKPRQQVDRQLEFLLRPVERRHLQLDQR